MAKRIDRSTPLFQVTDLCQYFNVGRGKVLKAVDHVHFTIYKGETLGLVGEERMRQVHDGTVPGKVV